MIPYSLLDLAPVPEGHSIADARANTLGLAQHAEPLGYTRYWLAEHHNMPGISSAATSVLLGQVAVRISTIRVGSGGVMLPNHAPLVIAEQFGTLATLYPGRIDLGVGRAPGTDMATALRRSLDRSNGFPQDVMELMGYFEEPAPGAPVRAVPGAGTRVPVWILGSSLYGTGLAAHLGLPYAFAADSEEEAAFVRTSAQQDFANLRSGRPGLLPRPVNPEDMNIAPPLLDPVNEAQAISATGAPETVKRQLLNLIDCYQPDEIILAGQIHDHTARKRSFEIAANTLS